MELHLGVLSFRETAFLDKVALAPYVLSHGTDYGSSIRDNGVIICGPLVPKEDVKISTSPMNANEFEYSHEIFLRACCPTDAVFSHRYGRTTFIFDDHESKTDFYNRGWFTFYDPLMPFHGSIKQLIWPPELPLPEEVGEITPLRQTRWDESTYSRWRHQYAGGSHAEQFIDTVFKANVFHLAIGLKVLVELRRIAQSNPIGLAYRNALLDAPPNIISQIIYRDFFRIEAKIPVVMPVNRAKFVHIHRDIRTYSDGTPSCLAELDETLRKIQEYKPGAAKKSGKAQEPIADLVKKFEKQVSHIFCIGKSNANIKIRSLIKRELANPAIMADLINQIELINRLESYVKAFPKDAFSAECLFKLHMV
ncbi:hypothetical protein EBR96_06930, partial [bacterium]|nr:hypothetical protein [bacterium]